jgi:hypothetical protein
MVVFVPLCGFAGEKIVDAGRGGRAGVLRRELIRCHSAQDPGATFHPHSFLLIFHGRKAAVCSMKKTKTLISQRLQLWCWVTKLRKWESSPASFMYLSRY